MSDPEYQWPTSLLVATVDVLSAHPNWLKNLFAVSAGGRYRLRSDPSARKALVDVLYALQDKAYDETEVDIIEALIETGVLLRGPNPARHASAGTDFEPSHPLYAHFLANVRRGIALAALLSDDCVGSTSASSLSASPIQSVINVPKLIALSNEIWADVKYRLPFMEEGDRGLVRDAGLGLLGPDDLPRLLDEEGLCAPRCLRDVIAALDGEGPQDDESRMSRYCRVFRHIKTWMIVWNTWLNLILLVHPDARHICSTLSRVFEWTLEMEKTHLWRSVLRFVYAVQARVQDQQGYAFDSTQWWPLDQPRHLDLFELHLGTDSLRAIDCHPPTEVTAVATPCLVLPCPECILWNIRLNGCRSNSCKQRTPKLHICLICKGHHRMVEDPSCKKAGIEAGLIVGGH